jgi:hypothetical protein
VVTEQRVDLVEYLLHRRSLAEGAQPKTAARALVCVVPQWVSSELGAGWHADGPVLTPEYGPS